MLHKQFFCPYCGSPNDFPVDLSAGSQQLVTDCEICCRPVAVRVERFGGDIRIDARPENG